MFGDVFAEKEIMAFVDLTHTLTQTMPSFEGSEVFVPTTIADMSAGGTYYIRSFTCLEHAGTHIDAPAHFAKEGATVEHIPLASLVRVPAVVVDVRAGAATNDDYLVSAADLEAFERAHGQIPERALVLAHTGWGARWDDPVRYRNADAQGVLHFPGFGEDAVAWLLQHRPSFVGIGVDTLSIDCGSCHAFSTHHLLLGADKYGLENLANVDRLPPRGAVCYVAPMKLAQGSGSPTRVYAELAA